MRTTLSIYNEFTGQSAETVFQALEYFKSWPINQQDKFCNMVFNIGLGNVADLEMFSNFTKARIGG